MAVTSAGSLNAAVEHASAILATDPAAARREAEAILKLAPNDPRGHLILASARRRLGDADGALAILQPLAKAYPRAAHTQYELGAALAAKARPKPAAAALRQAVALKPDLAEAWKALGDLLFAEGDNPGAEAAFAGHDRAVVRNPAFKAAAEALHAGRLSEAEQKLVEHLAARPNDVEALRLMAEVLSRTVRHANAEVLLAHALRLDPDDLGARFAYANALFQQQKAIEAVAETERLLAVAPTEPVYLNLMAACLALLGDFKRVIETYEKLLATLPKQPKIWLNHGHALRTMGERDKAVASYRRAIALAPGRGDAYWSLANLKVATLTEEDEAAIANQLNRADLEPDDRLQLHYALGKALEDRGEYAGAFVQYSRGAEIRRRTNRYDPDEESGLMARSRALFSAEFLAAREGWGSPAEDPIFVVGLPRSGSTLIEQILASHSSVEGTMELSDIRIIAARVAGEVTSDYPGVVGRLDAAAIKGLGCLH